MERLRTAVRTLADIDLSPDELLTHLDDIVTHTDDLPTGPLLGLGSLLFEAVASTFPTGACWLCSPTVSSHPGNATLTKTSPTSNGLWPSPHQEAQRGSGGRLGGAS